MIPSKLHRHEAEWGRSPLQISVAYGGKQRCAGLFAWPLRSHSGFKRAQNTKSDLLFLIYGCKTGPGLQDPNSEGTRGFHPALGCFWLLSPFHSAWFILPPGCPCCSGCTDGRAALSRYHYCCHIPVTDRQWELQELDVLLLLAQLFTSLLRITDLCFACTGGGCGLIAGGSAI